MKLKLLHNNIRYWKAEEKRTLQGLQRFQNLSTRIRTHVFGTCTGYSKEIKFFAVQLIIKIANNLSYLEDTKVKSHKENLKIARLIKITNSHQVSFSVE